MQPLVILSGLACKKSHLFVKSGCIPLVGPLLRSPLTWLLRILGVQTVMHSTVRPAEAEFGSLHYVVIWSIQVKLHWQLASIQGSLTKKRVLSRCETHSHADSRVGRWALGHGIFLSSSLLHMAYLSGFCLARAGAPTWLFQCQWLGARNKIRPGSPWSDAN